jgi:hypothetical protein
MLEAMLAQGFSEGLYRGAHSARMDEEKHPLAAMSGLCWSWRALLNEGQN